jgi:uncharacterized protein (TIGR02118 family)
MAREAFHEHWRTRHAELIVRLPGLRRYVQNYPLDPGSAYDAIAESSFDDTAAMKGLARTPEYAAVLADEPNFIDPASMGSIITEEQLIKDAPPTGVKTIRLVARNADMPIDAFFGSFLESARVAARGPGVARYVQCHTRRSVYESGRTPTYDGVEMIWSENETPPCAVPCFIDARRAVAIKVLERVVAEPKRENVVCP